MKLKKTICPLCRADFNDKLPGPIKLHFKTKQELEQINIQMISTTIDINDEYEFPPL
jgi:hypothetical protein